MIIKTISSIIILLIDTIHILIPLEAAIPSMNSIRRRSMAKIVDMKKQTKTPPPKPNKKAKRTKILDKSLNVLMQIFGMGVVVQGNPMLNKFNLALSMFMLMFHIVCVICINLFYDLHVNYPQNALTRSSFWLQYYGKILIITAMIASLIRNRDEVHSIQKDLAALKTICLKYKKEIVVTNKVTIGGLIIAFLTVTVLILFDIFNNTKNQNFFLIWTAYIPGISMIVYVAYMSNFKRQISSIFKALNLYLNDFAKDMPWQKKLMMRLRPNSHSNDTIQSEKLHQFFVVHNNTFNLASRLNKVFSFEYLLFMIFCLHGIILLIYLTILDLVRLRTKQGLYVRDHHFTEYWSVMYLVGFFMIVLASHEINESGNEASAILHNIRSIYYNLNEHSSVYAFQLMYTKVNTTAASFFDLDYSTLLGVLGITIKYVFILMQFDQGADMYYID